MARILPPVSMLVACMTIFWPSSLRHIYRSDKWAVNVMMTRRNKCQVTFGSLTQAFHVVTPPSTLNHNRSKYLISPHLLSEPPISINLSSVCKHLIAS